MGRPNRRAYDRGRCEDRKQIPTYAPYRWRETPDAPWQLWYGPIEGLDFEPGVSYKLRVREYQVPNPPADASSIRWQLLEVVERRRGG